MGVRHPVPSRMLGSSRYSTVAFDSRAPLGGGLAASAAAPRYAKASCSSSRLVAFHACVASVLNPNSRIGEKVGWGRFAGGRALLSLETHRGNREAVRKGSYGRFLYNWFRYFDPGTGRYLTPDPTGQSDDANVFNYVRNDPLNLTDPSGLKVPSWIPFVGGAAGRIVVDKSCEEECHFPVKTKHEELSGEASLHGPPAPGGEAEVDAVYSPLGVIKIPDNYTCIITCEDGQATMKCYWRWWNPQSLWDPSKNPQYFPPGAPLPGGFPKNPFEE